MSVCAAGDLAPACLAPDPGDLIERYAADVLAVRLSHDKAKAYHDWLRFVLDTCGEAGLLTDGTGIAAAAFGATGRPQDRYKVRKIGPVLDDFRAWVAGH